MRRIGYVIRYVRDLDASIGFYRDVLGLPFKFSEHGYAEFDAGGVTFGLYERGRLAELIGMEPQPGSEGEILVPIEDADAEAARLRATGVDILSGPVDRPWGHRTIHIRDPDGFVIELAQEIERSRPRGA